MRNRQVERRRPIALPPVAADRRQPFLEALDYSSRGGTRNTRLAEVAGGTTAECAAVCCCCPCTLVKLIVLGLYKLPAELCRKAMRKRRRRSLLQAGLPPPRRCGCDDRETQMLHVAPSAAAEIGPEIKEAVDDLDKEMMEKFYDGGFWRSSSRRNEVKAL